MKHVDIMFEWATIALLFFFYYCSSILPLRGSFITASLYSLVFPLDSPVAALPVQPFHNFWQETALAVEGTFAGAGIPHCLCLPLFEIIGIERIRCG